MSTNSKSRNNDAQSDLDALDDPVGAKFKILLDGFRNMLDQSLSKSKDVGDILRFLPGVVVQKDYISINAMVDLYRIKPDVLERLIKSTIEPLRLGGSIYLSSMHIRRRTPSILAEFPGYKLDGYLSGFLLDRDRSQLLYCDPMLQHISICRHFFTLVDPSDPSDVQCMS